MKHITVAAIVGVAATSSVASAANTPAGCA
jgi:hypothetical protein